MLSSFSNYEEDRSLKLSRMQRRVFPLSLFPPSRHESFLTDLTHSSSPVKQKFSSQPYTSKKVKRLDFGEVLKEPAAKPRTQSTQVPQLRYHHLKTQTLEPGSDQNRYFYKPCSLKISPRSTVTVYSPRPLNESPRVSYREKAKVKKKIIVEAMDEPRETFKLRRITSSKITFPAANIGQIMMRVKDLVLDPLRQEFADFHKLN